ncbi:MAG: hypothetical protein KDC54_01405 [Lewinella sp.]|nr:hypothetical protein [Lewinella sp.]
MALTDSISRHNFRAFLWHGIFLVLAKHFTDVDTIIPALLIEAGGEALHIGLLTTIMVGGAGFTQLIFAPYLSNRAYKKGPLLFGINVRILALFGLGMLMWGAGAFSPAWMLWLIILLLAMFSFGGHFAALSYTDLLGKSIFPEARKTFFSIREAVSGVGALLAVYLVSRLLTWWPYPTNYAYMTLTGGLALLVASLGFWRLREVGTSGMRITGLRHYLGLLRTELTGNPRLRFFLGYVNTQGLSLVILPFIVLYAKENYQTGAAATGGFLLFKVLGMLITSVTIFFWSKRVRYRYLLYLNAVLVALIPLAVLLVQDPVFLKVAFLLGGAAISLYTITMNGVLLELSGTENRVLYASIGSAGNLLPVLLPLGGVGIIHYFGFTFFFGAFLLLMASSVYFVYRLDCQR